MSADWDEVKRLAADFQRAQLSSTVLRLSERNCIEIVKKLIESKLIEVIFTTDGKDYLTQARLLKEIRDELLVHGGRINLVDLAQIIGVDFNHVESKAGEFLNSEPNTCMVLGQLITRDYLDRLAEEVNEKLQQVGEISVAEITKLYDLPGDFLKQVVHERLGTFIQGQTDSSDSGTFFTESYVTQHTARIQGALSALTRPIPLSSLISHFKFPEKLFYNVAENLIKEGRLAGSISGGRSERSIFIPDIYAKSQTEWISSFYKQNGYLEYDAVARLGILDPKSYLKKMFKSEVITFLNTCCVGKGILGLIEATVEEALNTKTWVDILPVLPSIFSSEDCQGIINEVTKSIAKQGSVIHVYCDTIVVSNEFLDMCRTSFEPLMESKAKEDVMKNPQFFSVTQPQRTTIPSKKEETEKEQGKKDRKEERKKKSSAGGKSGGGTQGREIKNKSVKKKFNQKKEEEPASEDEISAKESSSSLEFMKVEELENHLKNLQVFIDCPEELVTELANEIWRPLNRKYCEIAKSIYESSAASSGLERRKQHSNLQEKFTILLSHIILFEKTTKFFSEDVATQLFKHLLKTLCSELTNAVIVYLSTTSAVAEESWTSDQRKKMINQLPENFRQPLSKLNDSLNAKTLEDFHSALDVVLGPGLCDMIIRKPDKKKERQILQNHRESLFSQLSACEEPALCLHLAALLIFQTHTRNMLHASGKFVPHIIAFLQKQVPFELYQLLSSYQEMVIRLLTTNDNEEKRQIQTSLTENMEKLKNEATTYKKTSISETEN